MTRASGRAARHGPGEQLCGMPFFGVSGACTLFAAGKTTTPLLAPAPGAGVQRRYSTAPPPAVSWGAQERKHASANGPQNAFLRRYESDTSTSALRSKLVGAGVMHGAESSLSGDPSARSNSTCSGEAWAACRRRQVHNEGRSRRSTCTVESWTCHRGKCGRRPSKLPARVGQRPPAVSVAAPRALLAPHIKRDNTSRSGRRTTTHAQPSPRVLRKRNVPYGGPRLAGRRSTGSVVRLPASRGGPCRRLRLRFLCPTRPPRMPVVFRHAASLCASAAPSHRTHGCKGHTNCSPLGLPAWLALPDRQQLPTRLYYWGGCCECRHRQPHSVAICITSKRGSRRVFDSGRRGTARRRGRRESRSGTRTSSPCF
jgi:hypothetical protein